MNARPIEILMAEDNPGDVRLTREALRDAKIANSLTVVPDGEEALNYLRRVGKYARAPRPDLLLLDWYMPRKSGSEVLREMKADPQLRSIPVVILTCSQTDADITRAYELNANCYVTKPIGLDQFMTAVQSIPDFWFTIVRLGDES